MLYEHYLGWRKYFT